MMSKETNPPYSTTLHIRDHCLCLGMQRAARSLARLFDEALRPLALNNGQFSMLMSLNRPEPPTISSVATLLAMDRTTLTAALKPLERRGLIVVSQDSADRRSRRLSLTPQGRALLSEAVPIWRTTHGDLEDLLSGPAVNDLRNGLRKISGVLHRE